ncbi:MAG: ROK family protein [Rubripirellula sp.]|nr:ROK family protein [Rubripirellula sp.]
MTLFVGVDVGGTTTTISVGDEHRNVLRVGQQFPTCSEDGPATTTGNIVDQIVQTLDQLGRNPNEVCSIALATPGPATLDGVLLQTPNLDPQHWDRCPIRAKLEEAFAHVAGHVPVIYVGDGQAAALGEYAARTQSIRWSEISFPPDPQPTEISSLFMVAVGTGFGGGEVRDGVTIRGEQGRAGHAGHLMLPADAFRYDHDQQLKVGNAYCTTESAVSLTALTHQLGYRLSLETWRDHSLHSVAGTMKDKAKRLRELAADGDALALQLFDDQARAMGISLLMINYIGDYDLLVIGGGVCDLTNDLRNRYLQTAKEAYLAHALDGFRDSVEIKFSVCGDHASVIGALYHAYGTK